MSRIIIPNVTRDDRIGSVFNALFPVIHQTESATDAVEWDFSQASFLHPFYLAPLAIYKAECGRMISCIGMQGHMDSYFKAISFERPFDVFQPGAQNLLQPYTHKSYIPISRFAVGGRRHDRAQEILQRVIETQPGFSPNMKTPVSLMLGELIDNISEHTEADYGYLFCQRVRGELYITIADSGRTVYGSFVHTGKRLDEVGGDEAKALQMANEGISTKDRPEAETRGHGISKSRRMVVDGLGGAFFMLSGTAFFRHTDKAVGAINIPEAFRWNGTAVLIRLHLAVPDSFDVYKYI
jgi:hypothetical protein|nr:MAG TPA: hypothetical protein [Caudoviricetes sp.]